MNRKLLAVLLAITVLLALSGCRSNTELAETTAKPEGENIPVATSSLMPTDKEPIKLESSGSVGDYDVTITDFEIVHDYDGAPALLANFSFTNNSEESANVMSSLSYNAYQNGLQLDSAFILDDNIYNADDLMKDIKPGASIDVSAAFSLISETAPVEFEIEEAFSFYTSKLGKVFEVAEGGVTELSVAPESDATYTIGDYSVSIISYDFCKDYEGSKAILLNLGFTNLSNDTNNFMYAIDFTAFQDGVELETAFITENDTAGTQLRNVRPGAGTAVTVAYVLTSDTSPVEIEIEEYLSFSNEKIETSINITS